MNIAAYSELAADADGPLRVRAMFLSDIHLGTRGCQADKLLDFLRHYDADLIYLVGDIVDGWQLKSGWYWPQHHNDVVQKLLRKARKGTASSIFRAITTNSCGNSTAPISAASRW
jgi:DNA polymerase II small subunit/DNA polymerase delta subunit B